jgi:hypothetical protein
MTIHILFNKLYEKVPVISLDQHLKGKSGAILSDLNKPKRWKRRPICN